MSAATTILLSGIVAMTTPTPIPGSHAVGSSNHIEAREGINIYTAKAKDSKNDKEIEGIRRVHCGTVWAGSWE